MRIEVTSTTGRTTTLNVAVIAGSVAKIAVTSTGSAVGATPTTLLPSILNFVLSTPVKISALSTASAGVYRTDNSAVLPTISSTSSTAIDVTKPAVLGSTTSTVQTVMMRGSDSNIAVTTVKPFSNAVTVPIASTVAMVVLLLVQMSFLSDEVSGKNSTANVRTSPTLIRICDVSILIFCGLVGCFTFTRHLAILELSECNFAVISTPSVVASSPVTRPPLTETTLGFSDSQSIYRSVAADGLNFIWSNKSKVPPCSISNSAGSKSNPIVATAGEITIISQDDVLEGSFFNATVIVAFPIFCPITTCESLSNETAPSGSSTVQSSSYCVA